MDSTNRSRILLALLTLAAPLLGGEPPALTAELLQKAMSLQGKLAYDKIAEAKKDSASLADWVEEKLKGASLEAAPQEALVDLQAGLDRFALAQNQEKARELYGEVSEPLVTYVRLFAPLKETYQLYYCPMAKKYHYWTQPKSEKMANPYMGTKMLTCGVKKKWE